MKKIISIILIIVSLFSYASVVEGSTTDGSEKLKFVSSLIINSIKTITAEVNNQTYDKYSFYLPDDYTIKEYPETKYYYKDSTHWFLITPYDNGSIHDKYYADDFARHSNMSDYSYEYITSDSSEWIKITGVMGIKDGELLTTNYISSDYKICISSATDDTVEDKEFNEEVGVVVNTFSVEMD